MQPWLRTLLVLLNGEFLQLFLAHASSPGPMSILHKLGVLRAQGTVDNDST